MILTMVSDDCGDWEGVYVNGDLKDQGHLLEGYKVAHAIADAIEEHGGGVTSVEYIEVDGEWMFEHGHLPGSLDEIPKEARKE